MENIHKLIKNLFWTIIQILLELAKFYTRCDKNIGLLFLGHAVHFMPD